MLLNIILCIISIYTLISLFYLFICAYILHVFNLHSTITVNTCYLESLASECDTRGTGPDNIPLLCGTASAALASELEAVPIRTPANVPGAFLVVRSTSPVLITRVIKPPEPLGTRMPALIPVSEIRCRPVLSGQPVLLRVG